jgi:hypothetical protein
MASHIFNCCIPPHSIDVNLGLSDFFTVIPYRPRGTSSRSLSAWQATAQLVPLLLSRFSLTFDRRVSP